VVDLLCLCIIDCLFALAKIMGRMQWLFVNIYFEPEVKGGTET
jgi:hypothetical protein